MHKLEHRVSDLPFPLHARTSEWKNENAKRKCIKGESNPRRVDSTRGIPHAMATTQVTTTPLMPMKWVGKIVNVVLIKF